MIAVARNAARVALALDEQHLPFAQLWSEHRSGGEPCGAPADDQDARSHHERIHHPSSFARLGARPASLQ